VIDNVILGYHETETMSLAIIGQVNSHNRAGRDFRDGLLGSDSINYKSD